MNQYTIQQFIVDAFTDTKSIDDKLLDGILIH